jgi:hypothetical protein
VGMVIYPIFFQCFNLLLGGLILVQTFICDDGEWVTCFCSWCWHGRSKVNFMKDHIAEERATCPFY